MTVIARITTVHTGFLGAPGYSTFHFSKNNPVGWDIFGQYAINGINAAWDSIKAILADEHEMETLGLVSLIEDTTGELMSSIQLTARNTSGNSGAGYGPLAVGLCTRYNTGGVVSGKHVSGRTYHVPLAADVGEPNGTPSAAALATAGAFGPAARVPSEPALNLVVWTRPVKGSEPGTYARFGSSHVVTTTSVKDTFAVLRSRRD